MRAPNSRSDLAYEKIFYKKCEKSVDNGSRMCYTYTIKRGRYEAMASWYTVNHGAMVSEETFSTYEAAEMFALALAVATGEHWHVELAVGMPV